MRVIAGRYKGRRLEAPQGREIRPTTDKTKEAVFSILTSRIPEARVLDLFSGTGALGIEALSRGADFCIFCDKSKAAVNQIRANLDHCGIPVVTVNEAASAGEEPEAAILSGDVEKSLPFISKACQKPFDVILMDPPYGHGLCEKTMKILWEEGLLASDGIILCEHPKNEQLPDEVCGFIKTRERRYGISAITQYVVDIDKMI